MRRREFIQGIAGSATVWPLAAHAQSATGRKAAPLFHITLISLEARTEVDFGRVFAQMSSDRPGDPAHQAHMPEVIDFFLKNRIAGLFQVREHVVAGGLMSYGVSLSLVSDGCALHRQDLARH